MQDFDKKNNIANGIAVLVAAFFVPLLQIVQISLHMSKVCCTFAVAKVLTQNTKI